MLVIDLEMLVIGVPTSLPISFTLLPWRRYLSISFSRGVSMPINYHMVVHKIGVISITNAFGLINAVALYLLTPERI
jgi:hypothetical protein